MIFKFVRDQYRKIRPSTYDWRQRWRQGGFAFVSQMDRVAPYFSRPDSVDPQSPLEAFFEARLEGPGIWKWRHYFDVYHRHLNKFRQRKDLVVLEIGIYSGGSLDMWRSYFGSAAQIYGLDIEPTCRAYESRGIHILIGDQADRGFWQRVLSDGTLPAPDIVIDDGGHTPEQQRVTLEELLPHMRPGGVYICEDIHGSENQFASFVAGLADNLNGTQGMVADLENPERRFVVPANPLQASTHSIHLYPYMVVIERRDGRMPELTCPKHGTQWEPFLT
jgi:hypothetical protein